MSFYGLGMKRLFSATAVVVSRPYRQGAIVHCSTKWLSCRIWGIDLISAGTYTIFTDDIIVLDTARVEYLLFR